MQIGSFSNRLWFSFFPLAVIGATHKNGENKSGDRL